MGDVQVGYDNQWVFGLEANYSFLDTNNNAFVSRGLGSVTGRLGYTWGPALLYVKGGYLRGDKPSRRATRHTRCFCHGRSADQTEALWAMAVYHPPRTSSCPLTDIGVAVLTGWVLSFRAASI
jgi:hypothetical protein